MTVVQLAVLGGWRPDLEDAYIAKERISDTEWIFQGTIYFLRTSLPAPNSA